ncbi:MAG: hypothetical protein HQL57_09945 [Magnetococcales bacterium]|nr:hypothetical protein [Magnetococcales bacterium]MBF0157492.1 hypothetical protein [Magnetococcales bacterium]
MLGKTLQVALAIWLAAPHLKERLRDRWPEFREFLESLQKGMEEGPNPLFHVPLVRAIQWAFHTPAESVIAAILAENRFDYRFVTGRPRPFRELDPAAPLPAKVAGLWDKVRETGARVLGEEG